MWMHVWLILGNFLIGISEWLMLRWWLRRDPEKPVPTVGSFIAVNLISMLFGYVSPRTTEWLPGSMERFVFWQAIVWCWAYGVSVLVEVPLLWLFSRRKAKVTTGSWMKRYVGGLLVANLVTNIVVMGLQLSSSYWTVISETKPSTAAEMVKACRVPRATVWFVNPAGRLSTIRLDGTAERTVEGMAPIGDPDDLYTNCDGPGTTVSLWALPSRLAGNRSDTTGTLGRHLADLGTTATQRLLTDAGFSRYFRRERRLGYPPSRLWEHPLVSTSPWAAGGLSVPRLGSTLYLGLEAPATWWFSRYETIIADRLVLYQLGPYIALYDVQEGTLAPLARGSNPFVSLD